MYKISKDFLKFFLNLPAFLFPALSTFIRADGHSQIDLTVDPDQESMYILYTYGRKPFLLPVLYFSTNLVYPFTLKVKGI